MVLDSALKVKCPLLLPVFAREFTINELKTKEISQKALSKKQ